MIPITGNSKQKRAFKTVSSIIEESLIDYGAAYRQAPYGIERFADDIIGINLNEYQREIFRALMIHKRVAVRGLHGIGKTAIAAVFNLWMIGAWTEDVKCVNTASTWRQLSKYLFPEIRKWANRMDWSKLGMTMRYGREIQELSLKTRGKEAFAVASKDPAAIEGAHAKVLGYVLDEAKAIPDKTFDAVEGAFSNAGADDYIAYALAISTPGPAKGRFYQIHKRAAGYEDWFPIHVTLDDAIKAGRVTREWAEQRARQWGEKSPQYLRRVLAEFGSDDEGNLIPLEYVDDAFDRWRERNGMGALDAQLAYGMDVARKGVDRNAYARLRGMTLEALEYDDTINTMRAAGHLINFMSEDKNVPVGIDEIGVGGGVADRLIEQQYNVKEVNVAKTSKRRSRFKKLQFDNLRSELWWTVAELLDPTNFEDETGKLEDESEMLALVPDDSLKDDLTTPLWEELSDGRVHVESKDEIEARLKKEGESYRSSDGADALMAAMYAQSHPSKSASSWELVKGSK